MGLRITEAVRVIKLFLPKFPFDPLPSISWKQKVFDMLMFSGGSKENLKKKWRLLFMIMAGIYNSWHFIEFYEKSFRFYIFFEVSVAEISEIYFLLNNVNY